MRSARLNIALFCLFLILAVASGGCGAPASQTPVPPSSPTPAALPVPAPVSASEPTPTPASENATSQSDEVLKVHFIDVGQGDAILIDHGETEVLIDGGVSKSGVVEYLNDHVDGALEVMVATHPHIDHIGGLISVLETFEVGEIWLNGDSSGTKTYREFNRRVDDEGAAVYEARLGDSIEMGSYTLRVLNPAKLLPKSPNSNSIVLLLSYHNTDFLFAGDAMIKAEQDMLTRRYFPLPEVEILKVGHHGSKSGSSAPFLERVKPEVAIYMAGKDNQSGYPHEETLHALGQIGADIYGTDVHGTIIVVTDGITYTLQLENAILPLTPPDVLPGPSDNSSPQDTVPEPVQFSLEVVIMPSHAGTVKFDPAGGIYPKDTIVHLKPKPEEGYEFVQWTVDGVPVSLPDVFVTMDSDKTVTLSLKRTGW